MSEETKVLLHNEHLQVMASSHGAELHSIRMDGREFLWSGDPAIWKRHSPVLFPFVGRLADGKYKLHGRTFSMECHGFCQDAQFEIVVQDDEYVVFELTDSEQTLSVYPFRFSFKVIYALTHHTVQVTYLVENRSREMMYFGLGAHPGFMVPLEDGLEFEDYELEFPEACHPDRVTFSEDTVLVSGRCPYPLKDGKSIPLAHGLFDQDAIVLEHAGASVRLFSKKGRRSVTVHFPQMPYVGFWHMPKTEAPYICIEPWVSLPARDGVVEEFSARGDLIHLPGDEVYSNQWEIEFT